MPLVTPITIDDFKHMVEQTTNTPWQDASDEFLDFCIENCSDRCVEKVNTDPQLAFLVKSGAITTQEDLVIRCNTILNSTLLLPLCQHFQFSDEIRAFARDIHGVYGDIRTSTFPFRARYVIKIIGRSILASLAPQLFHFRSAIFITPAPDIEVLFGAIRTMAPANALEIGTYWGTTTLGFAVNSPKTALYTVDICKDMMCQTAQYQENEVLSREQVGSMFKNVRSSITQIFADSKHLAGYRDQLPRSIDFAFLDGDHSYEAVIRDTENMLSILAPGGLLFWHDYKHDGNVEIVPALEHIAHTRGLKIRHIEGTWLACAFV